jgi:hypothetical protein
VNHESCFSAMHKAILLVIISVCVLGSGCRHNPTDLGSGGSISGRTMACDCSHGSGGRVWIGLYWHRGIPEAGQCFTASGNRFLVVENDVEQ